MNKYLSDTIDDFWRWIKMSPQEYAQKSRQIDLEEYMFPDWDNLISKVKKTIQKSYSNDEAVDMVLIVMALDNEDEEVLDFISDNGSDYFVKKMVERSVNHLQPHARWQCAELIRRRKPDNGKRVLKKMLTDSDEYVRKRAKTALEDLWTGEKKVI